MAKKTTSSTPKSTPDKAEKTAPKPKASRPKAEPAPQTAPAPAAAKTKRVTKPALAKTAPAKPAAAKPKSATPKSAAPKSAPKPAPSSKTVPVTPIVAHSDVALRAYFIAQTRREHGHSGDEHQDWLEAERQILAELMAIAAAKG